MKLRPDEPSLLESLGNTYYNLAEVLIDLQRPEAAANYYERSGKLNPNGVTSFKLGNTFSLSGDRVRAVEAYRLACQLEPGAMIFTTTWRLRSRCWGPSWNGEASTKRRTHTGARLETCCLIW